MMESSTTTISANGNSTSTTTIETTTETKTTTTTNKNPTKIKAQDDNNKQEPLGPPSHITPDGEFVYLPPKSSLEKAVFFSRSVAKHELILADSETSNVKQLSKDDDTNTNTKKSKEDDDMGPRIHPILIASARIQASGVSELSKSINLGMLVSQEEYFGVNNIVHSSTNSDGVVGTTTTTTTVDSKSNGGPGADASNGVGGSTTSNTSINANGGINPSSTTTNNNTPHTTTPNSNTPLPTHPALASQQELEAKTESNLRSTYILKRKHEQFISAARSLRRFHRRCLVVTTAQRVMDRRLLELRKRWRLAAPEHGLRVVGPVRPEETVGIDVEIYQRDRSGGLAGGGGLGVEGLGKIARMVPRYATIELADGYDVKKDLERRERNLGLITKEIVKDKAGTASGNGINDTLTDNNKQQNDDDDDKTMNEQNNTQEAHTRAEPFAVADPTLGAIDLDFDPSKVPMLTLLFQIEKSSTGFVQTISLSSNTQDNDDNNNKNGDDTTTITKKNSHIKRKHTADEQVIQSLQHSLFCAKLFDSIRQEISIGHSAPKGGTTTSNNNNNNNNKSKKKGTGNNKNPISTTTKQKQSPIVWLSSEMEESFLPPPSFMVGGSTTGGAYPGDDDGAFRSSPLCLVHCHEGELKVQLDAEYALTVKLVDAKHSLGSSSVVRPTTTKKTTNTTTHNGTNKESGSQSPEQLHALCRVLLLHAQFVYHDYCTKDQEEEAAANAAAATNLDEYTPQPMGRRHQQRHPKFRMMQQEQIAAAAAASRRRRQGLRSPHILQSCVNLGAKNLFECKVRNALKRFSKWLKSKYPSLALAVEWLPLTFFNSHSQFALSIGSTFCIDVSIDGYEMRVSGFSQQGDYRAVNFTSGEEFQLYLQMETIRSLAII